MWDHSVELALGTRDVIGAWLVCAAFGAACLTLLTVAEPERNGLQAALIKPDPIATVAVAEVYRPGRC